jgi:sialidase-1
MERFTVSCREGVYECFPDVAKLSDGRLVGVWRESEGHVPRGYTRIVLASSEDDGVTWGGREVLAETSGPVTRTPGWNCPRISSLEDGRAVIACDLNYWPEGERMYRRTRVHLWWSEDGSRWEGPDSTGIWGIVPDKVRELNGALAIGTHERSPETGNLRQLLWTRGDGAWEGPEVVADEPGLNLCEGTLVQREEERAFIMRENSGRGLPGYKAICRDGKRWSKPSQVPLPGCHRPVAGWWGDRILVTYRCYMGREVENTLVLGALLDPESVFEDDLNARKGRIFFLDYDRSPTPDTGYTGWCEIDDDRIFVINYIVDDSRTAQIRGYQLARDDILAEAR